MSSLRLDAVGYFKTSNTTWFQQFGLDVDLSPDGYNFVAAAPGETVASTGNDSGAVYVFRRTNGVWTQRARLTPAAPPYQDSNQYKEQSVAIDASGNTVAVGLGVFEHIQSNDPGRGEVEVFHWNGTTWTHVLVPRVPSSVFGDWVELADSGLTLAVGYFDQGNYTNSKVAIYQSVNGAWQKIRPSPAARTTARPASTVKRSRLQPGWLDPGADLRASSDTGRVLRWQLHSRLLRKQLGDTH